MSVFLWIYANFCPSACKKNVILQHLYDQSGEMKASKHVLRTDFVRRMYIFLKTERDFCRIFLFHSVEARSVKISLIPLCGQRHFFDPRANETTFAYGSI